MTATGRDANSRDRVSDEVPRELAGHAVPVPVPSPDPRPQKPRWRGWLHLVWFQASLVAGTLLIAAAHRRTGVTAACIYAASVSGLFGASALYHRGNWSPTIKAVLQRVDHAMIFVLIAGTTTAAFLLAAPGGYGLIGVTVMWSLTVVAMSAHQIWLHAPDWLAAGAFAGLGLVAALAVPPVWINGGAVVGILIIAGCLLYIVGALCFRRGLPDPAPAVFGYHEVFHACVCAAATCHYIAIALLTL